MATLLRNRVTLVWAALIILTIISWTVGGDRALPARVGAVLVLAVAFIKVRYVGMYFMDLRAAPLVLRLIFQLYCLVVWLILVVLFLISP